MIVDNKPGGAGAVGSAIAAKSPPDGQTWMVTFDSHILNPAFAPSIPDKDSQSMNVMQIGRTPQTIAAHPDRPYKTFAEVAADAKARPEKVSFGVLGGSQALVLAQLINKENELKINLIPYKGGGPLVQDLLSGVTDIGISSLASFSPHIRTNNSGRSPSPARRGRPRCPTRRRWPSRASRHSRPIRGGASMRRPTCPSRSSSACMPRSPRRCARPT